jgi:deoxycytidine triphosphate deaminase
MRLAASEIRREIELGNLFFRPFVDPKRIEASSIDLCLSENFYVMASAFRRQERAGIAGAVDLWLYRWGPFIAEYGKKQPPHCDGYFEIKPLTLVLGYTKEHVRLAQHLGARVEGKSSLARLGLFVHISCPTIHPGFDNQIVLEFYNVGPLPIRVYPGDPICQLIVERVEGTGLYQGQFQGTE